MCDQHGEGGHWAERLQLLGWQRGEAGLRCGVQGGRRVAMLGAGSGSSASPGSACSSFCGSQGGRQGRAWNKKGDRSSRAGVRRVLSPCRAGPRRKVRGNKRLVLREQRPLPLPLQWRSFKEKKKPEDQTSLISCHPQRGVLHPQPAAADETAQAAGPAARAARGHRAAAPHRCKPFNGRQPRRSCDRGLGS